ncbi:phospholipase, partial [Halobacteriales archaeon QS_1_67_19]
GGRASRGWGVVVRDGDAADRLARVFGADADWRGTTSWSAFRRGRSFEPEPPANGSYPAAIAPANVSVESVSVAVAPDNAEGAMVSLLDSATESIRVQQVAIGDRENPFLRAALRAARRGVEVRILLSSAWYVREDNRALVERLNGLADREDLPLTARTADPDGRYEKLHSKGVVVDRKAAVVGSLNWNDNSARDNREVAVVLRGSEVAGFYADAFDRDWDASADRAATDRLPVGVLAAVAVGALAAILVAKREIRFETG